MLAYAPRPETRRLRPATLGLIVAGHAGLLFLVMTARSGIVPHNPFTPTVVTLVPEPTPPPAIEPQADPKPSPSTFTTVKPIVPPPIPLGPGVATDPHPLPPLGPVAGTGPTPTLPPLDPPIVRTGPRFATVGDAIRPPYPISKRESGDEASLRLRLTIDERGRVVAVDPVGRADPTFLDAARRHILRVWRYRPAMEGAKAIPSTTNITLKFELGNG